MTMLGDIKVLYLSDQDIKKSASGKGEDKGQYIKVKLTPFRRRIKFDTVLIPWNRVIKVTVF